MVTAYGREDVLKQAEESGFENVLIKPVTSSILFDTAIVGLGCKPRGNRQRGDGRPTQAGLSFDIDRLRGARVLLVEDNKINQVVAIGHLEDAELFVDLAENGEAAVQKVRDNNYDARADGRTDAGHGRLEATQVIRSDPRFRIVTHHSDDGRRHGL